MHNVAVRSVDALLEEVHSDSDDASPDASSCRVEQLLQDLSDDDDEPPQVNPHPADQPLPHNPSSSSPAAFIPNGYPRQQLAQCLRSPLNKSLLPTYSLAAAGCACPNTPL
jgi:hypothetical protein